MKYILKYLCKISEIKLYALRSLFNTNIDVNLNDHKIRCILEFNIVNNSIEFDYKSNIDMDSNISFILTIGEEKYLGCNENFMKFMKENSLEEYIKFETVNNIIIKEIVN